MENSWRIVVILIGVAIAVIGFAFAFSEVKSELLTLIGTEIAYGGVKFKVGWFNVYPNLISGIVIGIGGIVIAVIGKQLDKERRVVVQTGKQLEESNLNYCSGCGMKLQPTMKFCPNCGKERYKIHTN